MAKEKAARGRSSGFRVRAAINGKTKIVESSKGCRWTDDDERIFLETLAATCNVRLAARQVGFSTTAIYKRRMKWPAFAQAWVQAMEQGYARIEAILVERATDSALRVEIDGDWEIEPDGPALSNGEMLNLLKLHRASVRGGAAQRYDGRARAPDMDEVRASILRKIEAIERVDARAQARRQRLAQAGAPDAGSAGAMGAGARGATAGAAPADGADDPGAAQGWRRP